MRVTKGFEGPPSVGCESDGGMYRSSHSRSAVGKESEFSALMLDCLSKVDHKSDSREVTATDMLKDGSGIIRSETEKIEDQILLIYNKFEVVERKLLEACTYINLMHPPDQASHARHRSACALPDADPGSALL